VDEHVEQVKQGRERMSRLFSELQLHFWPSQTNFILVRVGETVKVFIAAMRRRGILVRDSSANPGCNGCVRITVSTSEQMDGVLEAIRGAIAETRR
jgi:histidinol-phosphate aminotransferase